MNDTECHGNAMMQHHNILIVDDETQVLRALQRSLRKEPYTVFTAESGAEALRLLESNPIELLLTDFRMPDMNGGELVEKVRELYPDVIRIMLSGYSESWAVIDSINRGSIYKFFTKPWDDEELKISLKRAFEAHELTRENIKLSKELLEANIRLMDINSSLENIVSLRTSELHQARDAMEKTLNGTVMTMSLLMDVHNVDLSGHGKRTARCSRLLAEAMNAPVNMNDLERASLLHDIGKIYVNDSILNKVDTEMESEELQIMRSHSRDGFELLNNISGFENVAEFVLHHHESFDGRGYPDGLKGENIPLGARIITVADIFDRLVNPRLNAKKLTREEIVVRMNRLCQGYLDPAICRIFLEKIYPQWSANTESWNQ